MTPEGRVKDDCKRWLDWVGAWYFMPVKHLYGRVGIPDIIICLYGHFVTVETKRPGNEDGSTAMQKECAKAVWDAGGTALVVSSVEKLKEYLYAHQSIGARLPARGSDGEPKETRRAAHASARTLRI
jgi:hypothetical protein